MSVLLEECPTPKPTQRRPTESPPKQPVPPFDESEGYELTDLGQRFVHYAMSELPPEFEFKAEADEP